jgi:serine/threonine-protein kinase
MAILLSHVNERVPPVRTVDPTVDPALADWVGRLTAREPEERVRSAATAAGELEDIALDMLGPRWRASSALVPEAEDSQRLLRRRTVTAPVAPALAATLPPTRRPTGPTAPLPHERPASRARRAGRALVWTVALVLAAVTAFAQGSGGGSGQTPASTPSATQTSDSHTRSASKTTTRDDAATSPARREHPRRSSATATPIPADAAAPARTTPTPTPTPTPTAVQAAAEPPGCAGDSMSDDPSDDGCEGGEGGEP